MLTVDTRALINNLRNLISNLNNGGKLTEDDKTVINVLCGDVIRLTE